MSYLILFAIVLIVLVGPSLWVKGTMKKYSQPDDRYPFTGAVFASKLLKALNLEDIKIESTEIGDHYDPIAKAVRLTADKHDSKSLTAITIAAHEVGHAHQHATGYRPFKLRTLLVKTMAPAERFGALILMTAPFIALITRVPGPGLLMFLGGLLTLGLGAVVHMITLPTELNASFGRALPMLEEGNILKEGDEVHARSLLTAAACTYVAASLMSFVHGGPRTIPKTRGIRSHVPSPLL